MRRECSTAECVSCEQSVCAASGVRRAGRLQLKERSGVRSSGSGTERARRESLSALVDGRRSRRQKSLARDALELVLQVADAAGPVLAALLQLHRQLRSQFNTLFIQYNLI